MTKTLAALACLLLALAAAPHPSLADYRDPATFTPAGYRFCGWKNFQTGRWQMRWSDDLQGTFLRLFARHMRCSTARRKMRVLDRRARRHPRQDPTRLPGYRARVLRERLEYRDVRYVLKSNPRVTFRFQTGS